MTWAMPRELRCCPHCGSTLFAKRRTMLPPYRCNTCKRTFREPASRREFTCLCAPCQADALARFPVCQHCGREKPCPGRMPS